MKNLPAMQETWVRSLGLGRFPGEGNGNPLQYSCLENTMDRGAWCAILHRVTKSHTYMTEHRYTYTEFLIKASIFSSKRAVTTKDLFVCFI